MTIPSIELGPVMVDIVGKTLTEDDKQLLTHKLVGGIILFTRNFESISQLSLLITQIRELRPNILIAVDHEGGRVQRFKQGFTRIPAMQSFLGLYGADPHKTLSLVKDTGWLMAAELIKRRIDITFAPVLDLDDNFSSIIGDRSFSADAHTATILAQALIDGMHEAGMCVTGKHFPGHGSVVEDSHLTLPQDDRPLSEIENHDLIPFKALLNKCDALMPAHIVFNQVDTQPVGFSSTWLRTYLKEQLNYTGVIFSDDLSMEGAAIAGDFPSRAKLAIDAGCDCVLVCNNTSAAWEVVKALEKSETPLPFGRLNSMSTDFNQYSHENLFELTRWKKTRDALSAITNTSA